MKLFERASSRDKAVAIRMLAEIRSIERGIIQKAVRECFAKIDQAIGHTDNVEHLVSTILHDGANLGHALSPRERRKKVNEARAEVNTALAALEDQRAKFEEERREALAHASIPEAEEDPAA